MPYPARYHDPNPSLARNELHAAHTAVQASEREHDPTGDEVLLARARVWQAEPILVLRIAELELRRTHR